MIDLAKVEAEDELRTKVLAHQRLSEFEKRASQADATIYSHLDTSQVRFEAKRKEIGSPIGSYGQKRPRPT